MKKLFEDSYSSLLFAMSSIHCQASGKLEIPKVFERTETPFWKHFSKHWQNGTKSSVSSVISVPFSVNFRVKPEKFVILFSFSFLFTKVKLNLCINFQLRV